MIIGKDRGKFLKNFFESSKSQAFLLSGADLQFEDLLVRYLLCENMAFCKKCQSCESESFLGVRSYESESLKIEEAREIVMHSSQTTLYGKKIFLIKSANIAPEAQATLLKTIEEPHSDTYFIISAVSQSSLSKPLLSRLTAFDLVEMGNFEEVTFKLSLEDINSISQNREEVEKIFNKTEDWIEEKTKLLNMENTPRFLGFMEEYFELKKRFFEKTYPPKMLLEHLAISKFYLK